MGLGDISSTTSSLPWSSGLSTPLRWGLLAGLLTLFAAGWYAKLAYSEAMDLELDPPDGKLRPSLGQRLAFWPHWPWALPGQTMAGFDWTGGPAATLVFVGTGITTILALSDKLDPVLDKNTQIVLTVTNLVATLIAGAAALAVACLQARYTPIEDRPSDAPQDARRKALGDTTLVASYPGVVLGSSIAATAVIVQIAALDWAANRADIGGWSDVLLLVLAVLVALYCVSIAGTATTVGALPAMMDKPAAAAPHLAESLVGENAPAVVLVSLPSSTTQRSRLLP